MVSECDRYLNKKHVLIYVHFLIVDNFIIVILVIWIHFFISSQFNFIGLFMFPNAILILTSLSFWIITKLNYKINLLNWTTLKLLFFSATATPPNCPQLMARVTAVPKAPRRPVKQTEGCRSKKQICLASKYPCRTRTGMTCAVDTAWNKRGFDSLTCKSWKISSCIKTKWNVWVIKEEPQLEVLLFYFFFCDFIRRKQSSYLVFCFMESLPGCCHLLFTIFIRLCVFI
jgi:hypothetical protein